MQLEKLLLEHRHKKSHTHMLPMPQTQESVNEIRGKKRPAFEELAYLVVAI